MSKKQTTIDSIKLFKTINVASELLSCVALGYILYIVVEKFGSDRIGEPKAKALTDDQRCCGTIRTGEKRVLFKFP